jgi:hypothetical protein
MRAEGHVDIPDTPVGVVSMERLPAWLQQEDAIEAQFQIAATGRRDCCCKVARVVRA